MTDSEFITKVSCGEYGKNEVLRYLEECPSKEYLRDAILVEQTRMMCKNDIPIIPSGGVINDCNVDAPLSVEVKRLFDALQWIDEAMEQHQPAPAEQGDNGLPLEIDTEGARKRFERAISANYMQRTKDGYKWLKTQIQLGYFCLKVFDNPRPINILERLFDVKKLSASISNAESHKSNPKARADVRKWINDIERAIFAD